MLQTLSAVSRDVADGERMEKIGKLLGLVVCKLGSFPSGVVPGVRSRKGEDGSTPYAL